MPAVETSAAPVAGDIEPLVRAGALALTFRRLPISIPMAVLAGLAFIALLLPFANRTDLGIWTALTCATYVNRAALWMGWRQLQPGPGQVGRWEVLFTVCATVAGAAWAYGGVVLLPDASADLRALLLLGVLAVTATTAATLGAQWPALVAYVSASVLPVAWVAFAGDRVGQFIGVGLLCWYLALLVAGYQNNVATRQLIRAELERGQALEAAAASRQQAVAASAAKSQFLANMSHEVRTPLNGVLGLAELLARGTLDERQRRHVGMLRSSGEHLLHVVNEILDLSKIEAGHAQLVAEPFDLAAELQQCASLARPAAEARGLAFRVHLPAHLPARVLGDAQRFRQVLLNLLSNATKFTEVGEVVLEVELEVRGAGDDACTWLHCRVLDTGIGIPAADAERVFDAFTQVEETSARRFGGTGLGLALCRELASLMGGGVTHVARPERGSEFVFSLPLQVLAGAPPSALTAALPGVQLGAATPGETPDGVQEEARAGTRRLHVLLAEDNPVNREVVGAMLDALDVDVTHAEDGEQAVARVLRGGIDLVLMDCQMPVLDGYAATRELRDAGVLAPRGGALPIVALTASAYPEERERARRAGMDGFLAKPLGLDELGAALLPWRDMGRDDGLCHTPAQR